MSPYYTEWLAGLMHRPMCKTKPHIGSYCGFGVLSAVASLAEYTEIVSVA
jgi:hypothetical protein